MDDYVSKQSNEQGSITPSESHSQENTNSAETGLKPTKANRKKFDLDLAFGEYHEDSLASMLGISSDKVEVKTERGMWVDTGNIAIEFESYGKPSGIRATESEHWVHNLTVNGEVFCRLMFPVDVLTSVIDNLDSHRVVSGGDNWASRMYLLNLEKLFSKDVMKVYRNISTKVRGAE